MNEKDLIRLEELNERYSPANLTGFRFVDKTTDKQTILKHIEADLNILNSCEVETKHVYRIIVDNDCIDICTVDNGTYISYLFTEDAKFTPKSIKDDVNELCKKFDVHFEELH